MRNRNGFVAVSGLDSGMTLIVSHRGGALLWPENSLPAFQNSLAAGVDAVECDVHLSSDGIPVVIHDPTLERTTLASGPVYLQTSEALRATALRGHPSATVPSLADVASLLRGRPQGLQVEIKGEGQLDLLIRTLAVLDAFAVRAQASVIAFDAEIAGHAVRAGGLGGVAWLLNASDLRSLGVAGIIATTAKHGVSALETDIDIMDASLSTALRAASLGLGAWGANDAPRLAKAFGLGLDLVATDDPLLALRMRKAGSQSRQAAG